MRIVIKTLRRLVIILLMVIGLLGLTMSYLDIPGGPVRALRAVPAQIAAEVRYRWGQGKSVLEGPARAPATAPDTPATLREAIGCEPLNDPMGETGGEAITRRAADEPSLFAESVAANIGAATDTSGEPDGNFYVSVSADNTVLPAYFERELNVAAAHIYDQWEHWLGSEALVRSHIKLRFMGDEAAFMDRWGRDEATDWKPLGFYRIRINEAVILYNHRQRQAALATAFHEMSHLITAWHLGPTPAWLNEGIAEYFETMDPGREEIRFWMDGRHIGLLRREGLVPLEELTSLSRRDWATRDAQLRYASAWALVAFLFTNDGGRQTLAGVINDAYGQRCDGDSALRSSLDRYPGGISALESGLSRWIRGGRPPA